MTVGVQPSAAAPGAETRVTGTGALDAMHAACASSVVVAIHGTMESLTDEDWDAMSSDMDSNQMDTGMMGQGQEMTVPTGDHAMGMKLW